MIPWSWRWESMRLFFVEGSCVSSILFWDHLFKGPFCLVHGFLCQFGCRGGFAEPCKWFFRLVIDFLPFFFCHGRGHSCFLWLNTGYNHWLTLFVKRCVLPVNDWFEGR